MDEAAKVLAVAAAALDPSRNSLTEAANNLATRAQTVAHAATTLAQETPDASTEAAFSLAKAVLILRQDTTAFAQAPQPAVTALALAETATALAQAATAWAQDPVQVKTIRRFMQREANKEAAKRNIIRELIKHENNLFAQRRSHFAILQGLMWASAALLVQSDYSKVNANLIYILAGAGALLALVSAVSLYMTGFAIGRLMKNTRVDPANLTIEDPAPVIGYDGSRDVENRGLWKRLVLVLNRAEIVPFILLTAWVLFAVYVEKKEDPGQVAYIALIGY